MTEAVYTADRALLYFCAITGTLVGAIQCKQQHTCQETMSERLNEVCLSQQR